MSQLALQLHPDKNCAHNADDAFKAVGKSFACLSDPEKVCVCVCTCVQVRSCVCICVLLRLWRPFLWSSDPDRLCVCVNVHASKCASSKAVKCCYRETIHTEQVRTHTCVHLGMNTYNYCRLDINCSLDIRAQGIGQGHRARALGKGIGQGYRARA